MTRIDALRALLITVVAASLVAFVAPEAGAHHRPNEWCSPSGDICQFTRKVDGVRKLRIVMAERYFDRFSLCVLQRGSHEICADYRVRRLDSGLYGHSVRYGRTVFPRGEGSYVVTWRALGQRVGARLGFHR